MRLRRIIKYLANMATPIEITADMKKWELKNKLLRLAGIKIGKNVAISPNFQCITGLETFISIDDYVAIGHHAAFYSFNQIKIGSFTMFAADVSITNGGHDTNSFVPFSGETTIGRGCWIGNGVRIVKPVTIGDNVIIAAGSVVTKDIPPGAIVAGIPATIIKYRELPERVWFLGDTYFDPRTFTVRP